IEATEPTVMQATPTTWSMLFDTGWAGSSQLTVLCGGEAMPVELGRRLVDCCGPVWNMFGPTETTIWSTVQRIDDATLHGANVPIGRPIANTVCRVLASNGELAPIGVPGELLIGGAGVARGYLDRDQLTAERFVADPYSGDPGARLYRTGDIARWLPSGSIEFLGRSDFQVKVRGHRIELGEIESALRSHPEVVDVVVVADGSAAAGRLLAYPIYSDPDSSPAVADLRTWMQSRVPDYMIPSRFIAVEAFPLTANRKIDRNALPRPDAAASSGAEYVGPRDPVEQTVAGIIADTLELERVGINDDFFELGGHSLHATSVLAKIDDAFGIAVDLRSFFVTPTVAHLAAALTSDPAVRDRVHKVAEVRVRLASMTPEQVARELAARRGAVENRRS
ncbi:MAG: non-ribosomal peptide synthetase, partial [Actinomycetota bacterium]|nr:non-ribosomal peptide synthetase [Actinomycetota bacterium]